MISNSVTYIKIQNLIKAQKFNEALILLEETKNNLSELEYWFLVSVSLRYLEDYKNALISLSKLIDIDPGFGRAYQEFGHVYAKLNNNKMALKSYIRAIQNNPSLQSSWLGILSLESVDNNLIKLAEKNIFYLKNLAPELKSVLSYTHEGKLKKAEDLCRFYLQSNPHNVDGMRLLASLASILHIYDESEFLLESCLVFEPENKEVQIEYVDILIKRQKYGSALDFATKIFTKSPEDISLMKLMAVTLQQTDNQLQALDTFKKIIDIEPNNAEIHLSKGHLFKTSGDIKNSIKSYQKAYKCNQYFGDAYWSLANLKTYNFSDSEILALTNMVNDPYVNDDEKIFMHFALGRAHEDTKNFGKSFSHYERGNSMKLSQTKFSINDFISDCNNQKEVCTKDLMQTKSDWGNRSNEPIFILGLPRVGSTLVEQILSSHSMVEGTHELPNILSTAHKLNQRKIQDINSKYPDILLSLSSPQLQMIGDQYIADAEIFRSGKDFFIDKMPNNFRHIGLIKLILPNAKIIDIRRNSMSACFSCYKQLFAEGQEFTYSLENLASYYNTYVDLMDHWNKVLPGQILSLNYEDLINEFEPSVDRILDYCNLPFEQSCLEFYKSKRSVKTPSAEQVRQPIYKSGLDYWKNYEPFLDDLKNNLTY
jgi:tetratricopeptide (TPR) repeat protein